MAALKILPALLLILLLSCESKTSNDDMPAPVEVDMPDCLLMQKTVIDSVGREIISHYEYDNQRLNLLVKTLNGQDAGYEQLEYNDNNQLIKYSFYNAAGAPYIYYSYEYGNDGLLAIVRVFVSRHTGITEVLKGYYEFASPAELKKFTSYQDGITYGYFTFEYQDGVMTKELAYSTNGTLEMTREFTYDDKHHYLLAVPALRALASADFAFPYIHNIVQRKITFSREIISKSYDFTAAYEYNEEGLPVKQVKHYAHGATEQTSFTYQCP